MPCHVGHDVTPNHGHNFDYEADFDARKIFWGLFTQKKMYLNFLRYSNFNRFQFSDTDTKSFWNLFRRNAWTLVGFPFDIANFIVFLNK